MHLATLKKSLFVVTLFISLAGKQAPEARTETGNEVQLTVAEKGANIEIEKVYDSRVDLDCNQ
jgi:hypothetical protein